MIACIHGVFAIIAGVRYDSDAFERLRERLAHVDADQGWFFARIAEQVAEQRKDLGSLRRSWPS